MDSQRTRWRILFKTMRTKAFFVVVAFVAVGAGVGVALRLSGGATPSARAFRGLSAAQHARSGASQLPLAVIREINIWNAQSAREHARRPRLSRAVRILPSTARVLGKLPDGLSVYVAADNFGEICLLGGLVGGCGPPPSRSDPIVFSSPAAPLFGGSHYFGGIAIDGVTSVSFRAWNKNTTVPVKHNLFVDETPHSTATLVECLSARFADGSTYRAPVQGRGCQGVK